MPPITTTLPSVCILGLPIHNVSMEATLAALDAFICSRTSHHVVTADASMLVMAQEDAFLYDIIANADLVTPDSTGILWAARRQGNPLRERVSGVDIVEMLCARSASCGYRLYFLGAGPGVAEKAAERMRLRYPGTQIVGTRNGFFQEEDSAAIVEEIRACEPDVLCVAMGIPKQEKWISTYRDRLNVPILIGVGGTLDVLSGNVRRAPAWMQRFALEWLWRVMTNPRKISKVLLLPRFIQLIRRSKKC
ncbi:MAG TPA: WecB/TagA/CpsF family glycosyltransferase [Chthonomonadaceae bacterium]|nr:WecB/TagA/CpsF family glycosyltransferase [Chthonomonadaceae bacterium]